MFNRFYWHAEHNPYLVRATIQASLYYLAVRLASVFLYALIIGESWSIRRVAYNFPVVAFTAKDSVYAQMNSTSTLIACIFVSMAALLFMSKYIKKSVKPDNLQNRANVIGWSLVTLMTIPHLIVGRLVNERAELELSWWAVYSCLVAIIFTGMALLASYHYKHKG